MRKILLDTNFILTCIKQKIDFFEELETQGFKILIPKQVIRELEGLKDTQLALNILKKNSFDNIDIGKGHVDRRIEDFAKKDKNIIIATLDKEIKKNLENPKMVIKEKKRLVIQ